MDFNEQIYIYNENIYNFKYAKEKQEHIAH